MNEDEEGPAMSLVMPFVICASEGGPFEDEAFVVGFACGQLDARLQYERPAVVTHPVRTAMVPQLDLIAMRYGYEMKSAASEEAEGWSTVVLTQVSNVGVD